MKYPEKVERHPDRIPDVIYPEKMERRRKGDRLRVHGVGTPPPDDTEHATLSEATISIRSNSIRIPQEDTRRVPLSGLPQGEAHRTRDHHTGTIAYPIRICCPDH